MNYINLLNGAQNSDQRFSQRLGGVMFRFKVSYVSYVQSPYWSMDITREGFPIAMGIPLNAGSDLLMNQNVLQYGTFVFIGEEATLDNLGVSNKLIWMPD